MKLVGGGGEEGGVPWDSFFRKIVQTHTAHNSLLCAYNLYVEFHSNLFTIIECCFRGSVNMGPLDPKVDLDLNENSDINFLGKYKHKIQS